MNSSITRSKHAAHTHHLWEVMISAALSEKLALECMSITHANDLGFHTTIQVLRMQNFNFNIEHSHCDKSVTLQQSADADTASVITSEYMLKIPQDIGATKFDKKGNH